MRVIKERHNFFDYQEIADLVELCENNLDGWQNSNLRKILRNTNGIKGQDPNAIDPSKNVETRAKIRERKEKAENILAKNKSLFKKPLQVQICKNILENIKILQKRINQLDTLYNQVIKTYSREDGKWAAKLFLLSKKNPNTKLTKTPEEKTKYDNFKKFFNTLNNIKVSTDNDKTISTSLEDLYKYCQRTLNNIKISQSKGETPNSSLTGNVVNRYSIALRNLKNAFNLNTNINTLINNFTDFNRLMPIGSKSYTDLISDLNKIIEKILLNLKDVMGEDFED